MKPVGSRLCQVTESEGDTNLTTRRAEWQARRIEPTTRALLARDEAAFLHQSVSTPCLNAVAKAEGIWIEDLAGRRYMDFHGNNVHHIGYGHPRLKAAIAAQMDALPFAPRRYACEPAVLLAEKLARIAPGDLSKVLFTTGGSDAIEVAVKVARAATGRFKTLSFWDAFHGAGTGAAALSGEMLFRSGPAAPLVAGALHIAPFGGYRCAYGHATAGKSAEACGGMIDYVLSHDADVAARAALTTIEIIEDEGLVDNAARVGALALERMDAMKARLPAIGDVRGRGLVLGIELVRSRNTREPAPDLA